MIQSYHEIKINATHVKTEITILSFWKSEIFYNYYHHTNQIQVLMNDNRIILNKTEEKGEQWTTIHINIIGII